MATAELFDDSDIAKWQLRFELNPLLVELNPSGQRLSRCFWEAIALLQGEWDALVKGKYKSLPLSAVLREGPGRTGVTPTPEAAQTAIEVTPVEPAARSVPSLTPRPNGQRRRAHGACSAASPLLRGRNQFVRALNLREGQRGRSHMWVTRRNL